MGSQEIPLFRAEVVQTRVDRLHGSISLATPMAWQVIGFLLLIVLAVSIVFLVTASYARVETVSGTVTLDKGVATIIPSRIRQALSEQDLRLAAQAESLLDAASAQQGRMQEQITGISAELGSSRNQIADLRQLIEVATSDYKKCAERGGQRLHQPARYEDSVGDHSFAPAATCPA